MDQHEPQLVLLDLNLPLIGGLDVLKQLVKDHPEIPVRVVRSQDTTSVVIECEKHGAIADLLKHSPRDELLETMREAINGLDEEEERSPESV